MRIDLSLSGDVLDGYFRPLWKGLSQSKQRAHSTYSMSGAFDGLSFPGNFDPNRHAKQHTLRAAPFFRRQRSRQARFWPVSRIRARSGWRLFHSSSPQKFISGETSSIPYSQPSGRGFPFQTTTEALLMPEARFVSDKRWFNSRDGFKITMQPYGFTIRVTASALLFWPLISHSARTCTREFTRLPRRFSL